MELAGLREEVAFVSAEFRLRRTCAKLCHVNGSELEQTQFLPGYAPS